MNHLPPVIFDFAQSRGYSSFEKEEKPVNIILMKKKYFFLTLATIFSWIVLFAQDEERYIPDTDPFVIQKLGQWQDLKFGLLMHWGTYSQWGIVESWSICAEDEGWCRRSNPDYVEYKRDYENLQYTFDPVEFGPSDRPGGRQPC